MHLAELVTGACTPDMLFTCTSVIHVSHTSQHPCHPHSPCSSYVSCSSAEQAHMLSLVQLTEKKKKDKRWIHANKERNSSVNHLLSYCIILISHSFCTYFGVFCHRHIIVFLPWPKGLECTVIFSISLPFLDWTELMGPWRQQQLKKLKGGRTYGSYSENGCSWVVRKNHVL